MQSQYDTVLIELQTRGLVTRNWALSNNISRLASIIHRLKEDGMDIVATREGGDYVYSSRGNV